MAAVAEKTGGATISATPSPLVPRNKTGRSTAVESLCDLIEAEKLQKVSTDVERIDTDHKGDISTNTKPQLQSSAMKSSAETPYLVQENQAIKRQKLEGGKTRQILQVKPQILPHKSKLDLTTGKENMSSNTSKIQRDDRKGDASQIQMKPKHTLTRPKEPGFKMMMDQGVGSASVMSTTKLEEETMPKMPAIQTSMRARRQKIKSSVELELEEIQRRPKFKARPINKRIFESKGDIGVFSHAKKQVTVPQEFHFAINERIPPPAMPDLFDKFFLKSECTQKNKPIPRNTIPKPFHLHTKERGAAKEKKHVMELQHEQLEEANPCPHTTEYPHVPSKPESKQCTRPEPFQLESLVRHEEEMQREMEEVQMRTVKAQPILKEDPIPVTDKVRKPLTQVQEFNLHADNRAVARAQFDEKVKEKEMVDKRHREESKAAKMIEKEELKQLRRTMVRHVIPAPKFDHPFCPQKCAKDTTNPKSPKERRKISIDSVVSSPAASMR